MPGVVPWVDYCYAQPSVLKLCHETLRSARGIRQGDPLGPALFALTIHDAILQSREYALSHVPGGLDFTVFYLDDGTVAGDAMAMHLC